MNDNLKHSVQSTRNEQVTPKAGYKDKTSWLTVKGGIEPLKRSTEFSLNSSVLDLRSVFLRIHI